MKKEVKNYYQIKKEAGLCTMCGIKGGGTPSLPGQTLCEKHIESYKNKRKRRIEQGLCISCGKEDSIPGLRTCENCSNKNKNRYNNLIAQGICTYCHKKKATYGTYCKECIKKKRIQASKRHYEAKEENGDKYQKKREIWRKKNKEKIEYGKANGLCSECNKYPVIEGLSKCKPCKEKDKETYEYYKSLGICTKCHHQDAIEGHTTCLSCKEKSRRKDIRKWQNIKNNPELHEKVKENDRLKYAKRTKYRHENFLCQRCGNSLSSNDRENNFTRCISCRIHENEKDKRERDTLNKEFRAHLGLCIYCTNSIKSGINSRGNPYKMCEECYNSNSFVKKE